MKLPGFNKIIAEALREDGCSNDVTSKSLIHRDRICGGYIIFKERGVVCGLNVVKEIFQRLDRNVRFKTLYKEGTQVPAGKKVAIIKGKTLALLTGERVALNFLTHLSGIATTTRRFVDAVRPYKTQILDTRKTTPGLRALERYAVRVGGGHNHRFNLSDMVLIKDNHRRLITSSLTQAIKQCRQTKKQVEIEVNTLREFKKVLPAGPDFVLLDNMSVKDMKTAVAYLKKTKLKKKPLLEASGGINIKNVRAVARTGIDRISIGALTHSRTAPDISMELTS